MLEGFLLGAISASAVGAAALFLRFWLQTRDALFLGFAAAFLAEAAGRGALLLLERPELGDPRVSAARLLAYLLLLGAIAHKNRGRSGARRPQRNERRRRAAR